MSISAYPVLVAVPVVACIGDTSMQLYYIPTTSTIYVLLMSHQS